MYIDSLANVILKFSSEITPFNENFRSNILRRLDEIVLCNQLHFAFTDVEWSYCNSVSLKEYTHQDSFDNYVFKKCISHPEVFSKVFGKNYSELCKSILTNNNLISVSEYEKLDFYKNFLLPKKLYYFALLHFNIFDKATAVVVLLRDKSMGAFSNEEIFILETIKPLIYSRLLEYYNVSSIRQTKKIVNHSVNNSDIGIVYLDENFEIFFKNALAKKYISEIFKDTQNFLSKLDLKKIDTLKPLSINFENMQIEISKILQLNSFNKMSPLYILYLKNIEKTNQIIISKDFLLTKREIEVVKLLLKGLKNDDISKSLGISTNTVRTHVDKILRKTETNSRAAAIAKLCNIDM